ncbi:MAG TPA: hypothetical protein VIL55_12655 [Naasia sp.]|jgi:ketosteroid isomerase-like protein
MSANDQATSFFDGYRTALLDRDAGAIAGKYAVPALILFPAQSLVVADRTQTEAFFHSAFGQYDGVTDTRADVRVVAETEHSIWADVTWHHEGAEPERFIYQLVASDGEWQIAVLTLMHV